MPNSDNTKLQVAVFDLDGKEVSYYDEDTAVDYVSLVSGETYGKPALVAPGKPGEQRSGIGDRVLYINTRLVPWFIITRVPS